MITGAYLGCGEVCLVGNGGRGVLLPVYTSVLRIFGLVLRSADGEKVCACKINYYY